MLHFIYTFNLYRLYLYVFFLFFYFFIFLLEINSSFFPYIRLTLLSSKNDDFCSHGSFQL